jgi:hypothetical protein
MNPTVTAQRERLAKACSRVVRRPSIAIVRISSNAITIRYDQALPPVILCHIVTASLELLYPWPDLKVSRIDPLKS